MNRNYRGGNSEEYLQYAGNIAYRFGFSVHEDEDGHVYKVVGEEKTLLTEGLPLFHRRWKAWLKLWDEYDYRGA